MNRYEFNAVHVIDPDDADSFRQELKAEHGLFSAAANTTLLCLLEKNAALDVMEKTLTQIPEHHGPENQEYCLDRALDEVKELLVENPEKLLELAKLEPPRFLIGGDDTTTVVADNERQAVTLIHHDTMDGEADAYEFAKFVHDMGMGRVSLVISFKDNADSFEYAKRMAEIRYDFMREGLSYKDFPEWLDVKEREGGITEEEAKAATHGHCLGRNPNLIATHMGIGYTLRGHYGEDGGYDDQMIRNMASIAAFVDEVLLSYGEDLDDTRLRLAQKFGNICQDKHCSSTSHAKHLIEKLISKQFTR